MNKIFTGVTPNVSNVAKDEIDYFIAIEAKDSKFGE